MKSLLLVLVATCLPAFEFKCVRLLRTQRALLLLLLLRLLLLLLLLRL